MAAARSSANSGSRRSREAILCDVRHITSSRLRHTDYLESSTPLKPRRTRSTEGDTTARVRSALECSSQRPSQKPSCDSPLPMTSQTSRVKVGSEIGGIKLLQHVLCAQSSGRPNEAFCSLYFDASGAQLPAILASLSLVCASLGLKNPRYRTA